MSLPPPRAVAAAQSTQHSEGATQLPLYVGRAK